MHEWNCDGYYRRDGTDSVYSLNGNGTVVDMCEETQDP